MSGLMKPSMRVEDAPARLVQNVTIRVTARCLLRRYGDGVDARCVMANEAAP
jgi:hypothetical protein